MRDLTQLQADKDLQHSQELATLAEEKNELYKHLDQSKSNLVHLNTTLAAAEQNIKTSNDLVESKQGEIVKVQSDLAEAKSALSKAEEALNEKQETVQGLQRQIELLEAEKQEIRREETESAAQIVASLE